MKIDDVTYIKAFRVFFESLLCAVGDCGKKTAEKMQYKNVCKDKCFGEKREIF